MADIAAVAGTLTRPGSRRPELQAAPEHAELAQSVHSPRALAVRE